MMDAELTAILNDLFDVGDSPVQGGPIDRESYRASIAAVVARLVAEGRAELLAAVRAALPRMIELERYRAERAGRGPETVDFPEAIAGLRTAIRSAEAADRAARAAAGGAS